MDASPKRPPARRARLLLPGLLLAAIVASQAISVFTVPANWDEFALLHRADQTAETNAFHSGGRPGLAVLALLPFVADCDNEIDVIRRARLLWLLLTLAYLGGVAVLVAELQPDPARRWADAAWAVALLALVPAFLEWSLQVRSDQIALAGGAWGGAALLASRRRPALALAGGALLALGYLGSQKAAYLAALAGLLAVGQQVLARELRPRRELLRALLCAAGAVAVVLAFRTLIAALFDVPERHASQQTLTAKGLSRGLSIFGFYRKTIGYSQYLELLPTLAPHGLLLAGMFAASVSAWYAEAADRARLVLAWAVLLAGAAVGAFHAAAFAYFWLTLGLFPAVAFALARQPVAELLRTRRARTAAGWVLALALAVPALAKAGLLLSDSQEVQRETFRFVRHNLDPTDAGFHPESGLFCQVGGPGIRTHFSQTIYKRFGRDEKSRANNTDRMMRTFREQPVKFIVQSFRLNQFPVELRRFWAENYQPYRASVFLAGRQLEGEPGAPAAFELVVAGRYRWLPFQEPNLLRIDDETVQPGAVVELSAGPHQATFHRKSAGLLVLAVDDPPGRAPLAFYKSY
jgi:hypothetical protein